MALTIRPSNSFATLRILKNTRTSEDYPSVLCSPQTRSSLRVRAVNLRQETLFMPEKTAILESRGFEKLHELAAHHTSDTRVPVYVMLPLDTVSIGGTLNKPRVINASLMALKNAGVEGVMVDIWWGVVEKDGPQMYNWEGYADLINMVQKHGLKLQAVMSFHQCGGNVGDSCSIPLPPWVQEEIIQNPDLVYTDKSGKRNSEYISLGCDSLPLLRGRTPIQVYSDFMRGFRDRFREYMGRVIVEIQVGVGPCGELRYPSYPESNGTWRFPGIGEFQCYDKYMIASLQAAAEAYGQKEWGRGGPHDSGQYNQFPEDTGFFRREGTWNTEYGKFFLEWYSRKLIEHGDNILAAASGVYQGTGAKLSGKVAGIHWHYNSRSHAAELTAGYNNSRNQDGYLPIARMFAKHGVVLNFTCMEMKDGEQPQHANCSPESLVRQVKMATQLAGIELAGENALERYDSGAFGQVLATSKSHPGSELSAFTYLRMNKRLFEGENWRQLVAFVKSMSEGEQNQRISATDLRKREPYVGFITEKSLQTVKMPLLLELL